MKVFITTVISSVLICSIVFYYLVIPKIIESRVMKLNLMQYNGEKDKFLPKDSLTINGSDIYYLQHGNFDRY